MDIKVKVKVKKDIPEEQIEELEDRVVYNTAVLTREYTKGMNAYPVRTKELMQQEVRSPIPKLGNNKYGLLRGTDYAPYVYKMTNVRWTNKATIPQWYSTIYRRKQKTIVDTATERALKEI